MSYSDPILSKYIDLIKSNTGAIKVYFEGEPFRVPSLDLPCLYISKRQTSAGPETNTEDRQAIALTITVITDVRKDISTENSIDGLIAGVPQLYEIMEGRDADYTLKDTSILGILRGNQIVDSQAPLITDINTLTRIDYSRTLANRPAGDWTCQASVDFVCTFIQAR